MKEITFDEHYKSMLADIKGQTIQLLTKIKYYEDFIDRLKTVDGYNEWIKANQGIRTNTPLTVKSQ